MPRFLFDVHVDFEEPKIDLAKHVRPLGSDSSKSDLTNSGLVANLTIGNYRAPSATAVATAPLGVEIASSAGRVSGVATSGCVDVRTGLVWFVPSGSLDSLVLRLGRSNPSHSTAAVPKRRSNDIRIGGGR